MVEIERDFGPIKLGHDSEVYIRNQKKPISSITNSEYNPHWYRFYEVLSYGPQKMAKLKNMIDIA